MTEYKVNYCYASYTDETAQYWSIGFMPYSELSFAFSINFVPGMNKMKLSGKKAGKMSAAAVFEEMLKFFSRDPENPASLGGKYGTNFTNSEGNPFQGFIFSISYGQKALEWFASRSEKVEPITEEDLPEEMKDATPEEIEIYLRQRSPHNFEELSNLLGMKPRKVASKTQKSPKLVMDAPGRSSLPPKKREIKGLPESRVSAKEEEARAPTTDEIQAAFDTIFKAIRMGEITEESVYQSLYTDKSGEVKDPDSEHDRPSSVYYKGFAGQKAAVTKLVKDTAKVNKGNGIDTNEVVPSLTLRLIFHRRVTP